MQQDINKTAILAAADSKIRNSFIATQELFVLKSASRAARRRIDKSDDEWSVALIAFDKAISNFDANKGDFLHFADLVIKRSLVDYFRKQNRYCGEISVTPEAFDGNVEQDCRETPMQVAVAAKAFTVSETAAKEEIEAVGEILSGYGFSFFDLAECSPKSQKTRQGCARAVSCVATHDDIFSEMRKTLQLPIKMIIWLTSLPRKLLERHRKYIIAVSEILSGDFPLLSEYLSFIRKEGEL